MTFTFQPWMKTTLIVISIIALIALFFFLYLLIAGADESRKQNELTLKNEDKH